MTTTRAVVRLELDRNSSGYAFIGITEFGSDGIGVRAAVLSSGSEHVADAIMVRRFEDMKRLMEGNISEAVITDKFKKGRA